MLLNVDISQELIETKKRITFIATRELYDYILKQKRIHGSLAAYIRYLIIQDKNKVFTPALTQIVYRQQTTTEITKTVFADPPRATDKDNSANYSGYGDYHLELMNELKSKIKRIDD
jgi:hypothetical protein